MLGDLLDAEFRQAVRLHEVAVLVAVVVDVIDPDVAETVDLRARAHVTHVDVIVVVGLRRPKPGPADLAGLVDDQSPAAWPEGWCLGVRLRSKRIGLASFHQLCGIERHLWGKKVCSPNLVIWPVPRLAPALRVCALRLSAEREQTTKGQCCRMNTSLNYRPNHKGTSKN